ncbi:hypothetical protein Hypma_016198 [Hypsizygus marmoreus]|uniref:Uncharacterized protein n=1 Tax=Hypsizygus marmoreus TaxID=39966 RepID=A0A369J670_HYPMA|nr:hypothetical protein Hypma_016198 [Hypsizygus marmoreus]
MTIVIEVIEKMAVVPIWRFSVQGMVRSYNNEGSRGRGVDARTSLEGAFNNRRHAGIRKCASAPPIGKLQQLRARESNKAGAGSTRHIGWNNGGSHSSGPTGNGIIRTASYSNGSEIDRRTAAFTEFV